MTWDLTLMIATLGLDLFLLPLVLRRVYVPYVTSASYMVLLTITAVALFQLGNPLGAAGNAVGAVLWGIVGLRSEWET